LFQYKIAAAGDLAIRAYQEVAEGEVNPVDEANTMWAGIKEKSLTLIQKLGEFTTVANPNLGDKFLAHVTIILSILLKLNLFEMLLIA
jgi:hypothetical protein